MKSSFQLNIEKPCHERWESFTPTATGGFCASCQKNVIDFSEMSESQLVAFFRDRQGSTDRLCGRFREDQLKKNYTIEEWRADWKVENNQLQYEIPVAVIAQKRYKQAIRLPLIEHMKVVRNMAAAVLTVLCVEQGIGQTRTISGQIVESGYNQAIPGIPIPGVSIMVKGTKRETVSDMEGKYEIEVSDNDTLVFKCIGFKPVEKVISIAEGFSKMEMENDGAWLTGEFVLIGDGKRHLLGRFKRFCRRLLE